jgi:hypothetical protein
MKNEKLLEIIDYLKNKVLVLSEEVEKLTNLSDTLYEDNLLFHSRY